MYARVTLLEIDPVRADVASAVELFQEKVLPELRLQPGYRGVVVLATDEGRGLLLSFWETADAADAEAESGWYADVLREHMTLFRSPPGRERYEVVVVDMPAPA